MTCTIVTRIPVNNDNDKLGHPGFSVLLLRETSFVRLSLRCIYGGGVNKLKILIHQMLYKLSVFANEFVQQKLPLYIKS